MKIKGKWRRFMASVLLAAMLAGNFAVNMTPMTAYASVVMATQNLWKGGAAVLYQKNRKYLYRMQVENQDVFCAWQFAHMYTGHLVDGKEYDITEFPDAILSEGDFEKFALICDWYERGAATNVRYAAAQISIWALIDRTWDINGAEVETAASHLTVDPAQFKAAFREVREYVNDNTADPSFTSGKGGVLPEWCATNPVMAPVQNMVQQDGCYVLELDMSKLPKLKEVNWQFPGSGWEKVIKGNKLIFTYSGAEEPKGNLWGELPSELRAITPNTDKLTVYLPRLAEDQPMISGKIGSTYIYINLGGSVTPGTPEEPGSPSVEIYRHEETFLANYRIDLEKLCAETGMELEDATFEVLEAFDRSQLGDGADGSVSAQLMTPSPWSGFRVCQRITTDQDGHASHSDYKEYAYSKTYCGGHPEPEYLEVPDVDTEGDGDDDAAAEAEAIAAENERLRAEWEALCRLCEEETDFHSVDEGEAREMMLSDRDETYETFIHLKYQYTVREIQARTGYILHGLHNDDRRIEVIAADSSEGGAHAEEISRDMHETVANTVSETLMRRMFLNPWEPGRLTVSLPDAGAKKLDEIRSVNELREPVASPANAELREPVASPANAERREPAQEPGTAAPANAGQDETFGESEPDGSSEGENCRPGAGIATPANADELEDAPRDGELEDDLSASIPVYILHDRRLVGNVEYGMTDGAVSGQEEPSGISASGARMARQESDTDAPEITVSITLPEPVADDEAWVEPGDPDRLSHTFRVHDHRTEGELHINKRDLELDLEDPDTSYAKTQGDATLEGAVYGLYAAADIVHPDGRTETVFSAGDLVSIATTDKEGNASFRAITEVSETSDGAANLAGTWVGHPLILGSYYVKEMSRSEGYELSVTGRDLSQSNREGTETVILSAAGSASATGLSNTEDGNDGSWNEFSVTSFQTESGYEVQVSGYPEGTAIYEHTQKTAAKTETIVTGRRYVEKTDVLGQVIYQTAGGGEYKLDQDGNPIPIEGQSSEEPVYRTYTVRYRLNVYPAGEAAPEQPEKWQDETAVDASYVADEANSMLAQIGWKEPDGADEAPWEVISLSGKTNRELVTELLDWFAVHDFWDRALVQSVFREDGGWKALVRMDYQAYRNAWAVYDTRNDQLYLRKNLTLADGKDGHVWLCYDSGEFGIAGSRARVPLREIEGSPTVGDVIADLIKTVRRPVYETYAAGETLLDTAGNPIPEMEWVTDTQEVQTVYTEDIFTPVETSYENGIYRFAVSAGDSQEPVTRRYRIETEQALIEKDGQTKRYNDYLIETCGAAVNVIVPETEPDAGSYIQTMRLLYPGQLSVYQDSGTRTEPVKVLERVIRQSVLVSKDIAQESYEEYNTYRKHRDPFTVLFGGYLGKGKKFVSGFHFKAYLVSDLENAGLLEKKEDGSRDYERLFSDESRRAEFDAFAVEWDDPGRDTDGDLTTLYAVEGNGSEPYYGRSVMLPYGTYVVVEQVPDSLVNRHYELDEPKEVEIPFVPEIDAEGNVHEDVPSGEYLYWSDMTAEEMTKRYLIRFQEESDVILAHSHDGDFEVRRYGFGETKGKEDQVYYQWVYDRDGQVTDYGVTKDGVDSMTGVTTALNGKYAKALVPWSVLDPRYGEVIDDQGNVGNREPGRDQDGQFNYVAFAKTHLENTWYSSKLRIEKVDEKTGENIIHDGAIFRLYLASRDVTGDGAGHVTGTGHVSWVTKTVAGTRAWLEARGDVDDITWDPERGTFTGTMTEPDYDRMELVTMVDGTGQETGIFRAFSTEREIQKEDGSIQKEQVGYIETYEPLGAGTYVLVEVQAPAGYQKSRPVAFEVYRDEIVYYEDGDPDGRTAAQRYQYAQPLTGGKDTVYRDTAQIVVKDSPSELRIHKVEDGDARVGDENGLDGLAHVNDRGDLLTYEVRGRKEYLEARGDVEDISWDPEYNEYRGSVTKAYEEWSERMIAGTEEELLAREDVKVLYDVETGAFSGYGIAFSVPVAGAQLTLYEGLELKKDESGEYLGVTVTYEAESNQEDAAENRRTDAAENGRAGEPGARRKVSQITASVTGSHLEITTKERTETPPYLRIWDTERLDNAPVSLVFYDLEITPCRKDETTGELWILDERGNPICLADPETGMAYTYDDNGRLIAYIAGEDGRKKTASSIEVHEDGAGDSIYVGLKVKEDEVGLPLYYLAGTVTYREEIWETGQESHAVSRLPFGAYILEETEVPYDLGYIQSPAMGLILRESSEEQHFYFQNAFTKTNFAKIDVTTKEEIQDAGMTLYRAEQVADDSERGFHLEKGEVYAEWISGLQYDDDGNLKLIRDGETVATTQPHWIDHIPAGYYILEETRTPYEWGYVQSTPMELLIKETGHVQTFVMEDDYTAVEIRKYDSVTGEVLDDNHRAVLSLYPAVLDENGEPMIKTTKDRPGREIAVYDPDGLIATWETGSGEEIKATGRAVTDEYGETKTVYDYEIHSVDPTPQIRGARYYITETGSTRFEYLPVGYYVLVEEKAPPGYATAAPQLITVRETGQNEEVQRYEMADVPLTLEVSKTDAAGGGKEVKGAAMAIYQVIRKESEDGVPAIPEKADTPMYTWISGSDGVYTETDRESGLIPLGFEVGDLRLHRISYIPAGEYILTEETTPYGFLQAQELLFTVTDTQEVQGAEMVDEIPVGRLVIRKHDEDQPETLLSGAVFTLTNSDTGQILETLVTGSDGCAESATVPIGRAVDGRFLPYTYVVEEIDAPDHYMLNTGRYEFQFIYQDEKTPVVETVYEAKNRQNQVKIAKKDPAGDHLAGARLKVVSREDQQTVIDQWISTEQDYYINGIAEGNYLLVEVETPGVGYALAEPVAFEVTADMTEPVYVEMTDESTRVEVEKVTSGTQKPLAGARLQLWQLRDGEEDFLIREWTSGEEKGEVFYGLEPGRYRIHELSAPAGYRTGADMEILVEQTGESQIFRYENKKRPDGGNPDPVRETIRFRKVSDTGAFLSGAEFTFYDQEGRVMAVRTSDSRGEITILKPQPGTYTFRETKTPQGYLSSERIYSFTVRTDGTVTGDYRIINSKAPEMILTKVDGVTGEPVAGAVYQVLSETGQETARVRTDEEGRLVLPPVGPGTWILKEAEAPEGYSLNQGYLQLKIGEDGSVEGADRLTDYPEGRKVGVIIATYCTDLNGGAKAADGHPGRNGIPKTGEEGTGMWYELVFLLSAAGAAVCLGAGLKKKRGTGAKSGKRGDGVKPGKNSPGAKLLAAALLAAAMSAGGETTYAASLTKTAESEVYGAETAEPGISVRELIYETTDPEQCTDEAARERFEPELTESGRTYRLEQATAVIDSRRAADGAGFSEQTEPFADDSENHEPEEMVQRNGKTYRLLAYQVSDMQIAERSEDVQGTISYEGVERLDSIPLFGEVEIRDRLTGETRTETLPILSCRQGEEYWSDQFSFPVTVTDYDADTYLLGSLEIPATDNLMDYSRELLGLIGADPEWYEIRQVEWLGEPYRAEGKVYRNARASGRKLVYDAQAVYGGTVVWESRPGQVIDADYAEDREGAVVYTVKATAVYRSVQEEEPDRAAGLWHFLRKFWLAVSIGLLLLILFLISVIYTWRKSRTGERAQNEKT